ncbi:hypothetical protein A3L04_01205 [Thermococcus chitonophagus]|uniref:Uncharacterized protein n=1 Tax=Thermococcus chitonophagus TaxID=54262 RepID=A0A160VQ80_9EURY|nr:hypothetical protein [Thermococcus chitonophagus]ASJ15785.1 hypothetical protein A3L04_01205 [Thermococcus chitonophagus]CUX77013.1 hypothetical protein CHITON_0234 [Thermococcus chitonophagus]
MLVKIRIKYIDGEDKLPVMGYDFRAGIDNTIYSPELVVMPKTLKEFEYVELLPGGEVEGWVAFIVPQGKLVRLYYTDGLDTYEFARINP